jgi:hypothetical protein
MALRRLVVVIVLTMGVAGSHAELAATVARMCRHRAGCWRFPARDSVVRARQTGLDDLKRAKESQDLAGEWLYKVPAAISCVVGSSKSGRTIATNIAWSHGVDEVFGTHRDRTTQPGAIAGPSSCVGNTSAHYQE